MTAPGWYRHSIGRGKNPSQRQACSGMTSRPGSSRSHPAAREHRAPCMGSWQSSEPPGVSVVCCIGTTGCKVMIRMMMITFLGEERSCWLLFPMGDKEKGEEEHGELSDSWYCSVTCNHHHNGKKHCEATKLGQCNNNNNIRCDIRGYSNLE